ncbi:E3 ubiquitin-protein ligase TRIM45-like [Sycon ciliatum]|uniref:E3 ubiquitin-protein ligase TRIM45-like n=1 Tax=Sycon ciliatum TaxID=27933 RepID=UPI0020AE4F6F
MLSPRVRVKSERDSQLQQEKENGSRWTCALCSGELRGAKLLPCLHPICSTCRISAKCQDGSLRCDRCSYIASPRQVDRLCTDYLACDKVALRTLHDPQKPIVCDECVAEEIATHRCVNCYLFLCSVHLASHRLSKSTKSHNPISLNRASFASLAAGSKSEQMDMSSSLLPSAQSGIQCPRHAQNEAELFCESCSESVCRDCIVVDHKCHKWYFMEDAVQRANFSQLVPSAEKALRKARAALDAVRVSREALATNLCSARDDVEKVQHEIQQLLDQRSSELRTQVHAMQVRKSTLLDNQRMQLSSLEGKLAHACMFANTLLEYGSKRQCLALKGVVDARLKSLLADACEKPFLPHDDGSLDVKFDLSSFQETLSQLGQVTSAALTKHNWLMVPDSCYTQDSVLIRVDMRDDAAQVAGRTLGTAAIGCKVTGPAGQAQDVDDARTKDGQKTFKFTPNCGTGCYTVNPTVGGLPVLGSVATISVTEPPWRFQYSSKSSILKQHGRKHPAYISPSGLLATFQNEMPRGKIQQQQINKCKFFGSWGLSKPYRLIAGSRELSKDDKNGTCIWRVRIVRQESSSMKSSGSQDLDQPDFGVGVLVNLSAESIEARIQARGYSHDFVQSCHTSAVVCFSTGTVFCGEMRCEHPHLTTRSEDKSSKLHFQNGEELTLEYEASNACLMISQATLDLKCIVHIPTGSMRIVPLDADSETVFQNIVFQNIVRHTQVTVEEPQDNFGSVSCIVPVVWVSADCSCQVSLAFPVTVQH